MKEVLSRNAGTSMKNKHNLSKIYNIELIEESVEFRLYQILPAPHFLVKGVED